MKKIFIFGSINTDLVINTPYMPESGETITGSGFFTARGGKGANQAVAAARLGGKASMCGCVGNDSFGKDAINSLQNDGVDVSYIRVVDNVPTGTAVIVVENGDNRIILDKGANACITVRDADEFLATANAGDIFLTQLENPIDVIGYALKVAKEKGMFTILNPAPANVEIAEYFKYVDLITPNETELAIFGGKEKLFEKGIKKVVTTLGGDGYEIADGKTTEKYSCIKIKAVDTTAAGDTLCGGLAVGLSRDKTLEESCAYGSKAATIACTRKGAQPSIPTENEVKNYK